MPRAAGACRARRQPSVWGLGPVVLMAAFALAACGSGAPGNGSVSGSGGVDTGKVGSRCEPRSTRLTRPAEPGTHAGSFRGDYYELGDPLPTRQAAPLMLVIHGGGWSDDGPGQVQGVRNQADRWRARGWRTLNLDYHACSRSLGDVLAFFDHFRSLAKGHAVCADGFSAGGHLALMLAAEREQLRCVIGRAAPTDLPSLARQQTSASSTAFTGAPPTAGPLYTYNLAVAAFGARRLAALSPALQTRRIKARVLLALADNDIFIPWAQQREFADRHHGYTDVLRLPVGRIVWLHGTTTAQGLAFVSQAERRLTASLG
jgi:acetyl esterase/lipase